MKTQSIVLALFSMTLPPLCGCDDSCLIGNPGSSDVNVVVDGGAAAAGVYLLTLAPSVSTTTCVDARTVDDETYAYTLEFKESSDGSGLLARLLVDGFLFVGDGEFLDDSDLLYYETDTREEPDREGGAITYKILGNASLSSDGTEVVWAGSEQIRVLSSEDPNVPAGCIFEYDVSGEKVCDE